MKNQVEISDEEIERYTNWIKKIIENNIENQFIQTEHGFYEISHKYKTVRLLFDKQEQFAELYEIDRKIFNQSGYSVIF